MNAQTAKRRAAKKHATPKWLTKDQLNEIKQYYILAKELQWLSLKSDPLTVDHIVPLVSPNVCGLHVPWNLQILPRSQNSSKGNRI
jgi:5-methylcytosine-specific restriction endonuclease McrA